MNGTTTVFVSDAANREVLEYDGSSGAIQRWYAYGLGSNDVLNQMNVAANTRATLSQKFRRNEDSQLILFLDAFFSPPGHTGEWKFTISRLVKKKMLISI